MEAFDGPIIQYEGNFCCKYITYDETLIGLLKRGEQEEK